VARMGERRGAYRALVGKPEGRRPLGRPRRRWEDNIKMDVREVRWGCPDFAMIFMPPISSHSPVSMVAGSKCQIRFKSGHGDEEFRACLCRVMKS
jgi:hypothetical protein